jgi:hypothetical protein
MFSEDDIIHTYTRTQAIEDGFLVDVTNTASDAGLRFPVALTRTVWGQYVEVPAGVEGQDEAGRLWDILWMLAAAIRRSKDAGDTLHFQLYVRNNNRRTKLVSLKAVCGPNDDASPCITVMLPDED